MGLTGLSLTPWGFRQGTDRAQMKCWGRERLGATKTRRWCHEHYKSKEDQDPSAQGSLFWDSSAYRLLQIDTLSSPSPQKSARMAVQVPDSTTHQAERGLQGNAAWRYQPQPCALNTCTPQGHYFVNGNSGSLTPFKIKASGSCISFQMKTAACLSLFIQVIPRKPSSYTQPHWDPVFKQDPKLSFALGY